MCRDNALRIKPQYHRSSLTGVLILCKDQSGTGGKLASNHCSDAIDNDQTCNCNQQ